MLCADCGGFPVSNGASIEDAFMSLAFFLVPKKFVKGVAFSLSI